MDVFCVILVALVLYMCLLYPSPLLSTTTYHSIKDICISSGWLVEFHLSVYRNRYIHICSISESSFAIPSPLVHSAILNILAMCFLVFFSLSVTQCNYFVLYLFFSSSFSRCVIIYGKLFCSSYTCILYIFFVHYSFLVHEQWRKFK